jgi:hypothetical protein
MALAYKLRYAKSASYARVSEEALRTALTEALAPQSAQPVPPHECKTDAEKLAYAAGWWKALEANRAQPVREPLSDDDIADIWDGWLIHITDKISAIQFARAIEADHGIGCDK